MSLEKAISERWDMSGALLALVADDRVYTGWVPAKDADYVDLGLPMVSVKRTETEVLYPSGPNKLTDGELHFRCWEETIAKANAIAELIDDTYADGELLVWNGGQTLVMQQIGMEQDRMDDGTWMVAISYRVKTSEKK